MNYEVLKKDRFFLVHCLKLVPNTMITDSKGKIKPTTTTPQTNNNKKEKKRKKSTHLSDPPFPSL